MRLRTVARKGLPRLIVVFCAAAAASCATLADLADYAPSDAGSGDATQQDGGGDASERDAGEDASLPDTGASGDVSPPETSTTSDASGRDGGEDATPPEAGDGGDAAQPDTGAAGDASPPQDGGTFCTSLAMPHVLCADFDEGMPYATGFSSNVRDGGTLALDSDAAYSPPNSLEMTVTTPIGQPLAYVEYGPTVKGSIVHLEAEIISSMLPSSQMNLLTVLQSNQATYYVALSATLSTTGVAIIEGTQTSASSGLQTNATTPVALSGSGWHRLALDLDLSSSAPATLTVDGTVVLSYSPVYDWLAGGTFAVQIGDEGELSPKVATVNVDNVWANVK